MNDYYNETLDEVQYAFKKILEAVKTKNLDAIEFIATQEIKALNYDLNLLKGNKK